MDGQPARQDHDRGHGGQESRADARLPSVTGANRVKFTLDGKLALVSRLSIGRGGGAARNVPSIIVFDRATRKEVKQINTGGGVGGLLMQPDGSRAYGSSREGVVVIDLKTMTVVGTIDVGPEPGRPGVGELKN